MSGARTTSAPGAYCMVTGTLQRGFRNRRDLDRELSLPTGAPLMRDRAGSLRFVLEHSGSVEVPIRSANALSHKQISLGVRRLESFTQQGPQVRTLCRPPELPENTVGNREPSCRERSMGFHSGACGGSAGAKLCDQRRPAAGAHSSSNDDGPRRTTAHSSFGPSRRPSVSATSTWMAPLPSESMRSTTRWMKLSTSITE